MGTVVVGCFVSCGDRGGAACAPPVTVRRSLHTHTHFTLPRSRRAFEISRVAVHQNREENLLKIKEGREMVALRLREAFGLAWLGLGLGLALGLGLIRGVCNCTGLRFCGRGQENSGRELFAAKSAVEFLFNATLRYPSR